MKTINQIMVLLFVIVNLLCWKTVSAETRFKIPLPQSSDPYQLTVEFGGNTMWGGTDDYHTKKKGCYYALDFDGLTGDSVVSSAPGKILEIGEDSCRGKYVIIDHGDGWTTHYYHLNSHSVAKDNQVGYGREIGKMGNTGCSEGDHLHISYKYNGECNTDPTPISGYTSFVAGQTYRSDNDSSIRFTSQSSSSPYLSVFKESYERFAWLLGEPISDEVFELSWYPGVLVKEYRYGRSGYSTRGYDGYALLVLDVGGGNDFFPIPIHSLNLFEFLEGDGACGAPITPEYDNNPSNPGTESRQEFKNNCYFYYKKQPGSTIFRKVQGNGFLSPGRGDRWLGQASYHIALNYWYAGGRNILGESYSGSDFLIYGYQHPKEVHNLFPNEPDRKAWGVLGQPFKVPNKDEKGFIIFNPFLNASFDVWGDIFKVYSEQMGFTDGPLGIPTSHARNCQNQADCDMEQLFQGGRIVMDDGALYALNSDNCAWYADGIRNWDWGYDLCATVEHPPIDTSTTPTCPAPPQLADLTLIQLVSDDGVTLQNSFYIQYPLGNGQKQLVYLPNPDSMKTAWQYHTNTYGIPPETLPQCVIDQLHPVSTAGIPEAGFPNFTVMHHDASGTIYLLENYVLRPFKDWDTYIWYINNRGISPFWSRIHIGADELILYPRGPDLTVPCALTDTRNLPGAFPSRSILQWRSDGGTETRPSFYYVYQDRIWLITSYPILEALQRFSPHPTPKPVQECTLQAFGTQRIDQRPDIAFPEGAVVHHTPSGTILSKQNHMWHRFPSWDDYVYFQDRHGVTSPWVNITDYEYFLMREGNPWVKPGRCQAPFQIPHGTVIRKQGDDGTLWPYVYVMFHGQLIYTTTDPQYLSYNALASAVPLNYCVIDYMTPIPTYLIPHAAIKEGTLVHHVPTGKILINDNYMWHWIRSWDDYIWFINNRGITPYWINISDLELSFLPMGQDWVRP